MSREQLLAILAVLGVLAGAIQQFYALKTEVAELRLQHQYVHGTWIAPERR